MTRSKPETQLQAVIVAALGAAGRIAWRVNSGSVRVRRGYLHGAPEGAPDLYVLGWGWLEIKGAKGKLNEAQEKTHELLRAHGERVAVVRSAEEALEVVRG
jgi:hypothetical protein